MISPPLLLAAVLVCGLLAWVAVLTLPADAAFAAARGTALPKLTGIWQAQARAVDAEAAALRANAAGNASGAVAGGLSAAATEPASSALDGDPASAENTGGLPIAPHRRGPGPLPWTSAPIMRAWQTFGQVADTPGLVHGGTESELVTNYGQAGQPMFTSAPGCYLDHEASFITAFYTQDKLSGSPGAGAHPRPKTDFEFIPFPPLTSAGRGSAEVAGDLLGIFRNTSAARKLIAYLTTPQAQEAWISRPGSGAISVDRLVPLSDYPDPLSRELAGILTRTGNVRFDASDSMPLVMESAFNNAVLEYLDSPGQLNVILHGLDQVRKAAY